MARTISFSEATLEAMQEEMRRDPTVFLMGEDIAKQGGIFGQFKGCRRSSASIACATRRSPRRRWSARASARR